MVRLRGFLIPLRQFGKMRTAREFREYETSIGRSAIAPRARRPALLGLEDADSHPKPPLP